MEPEQNEEQLPVETEEVSQPETSSRTKPVIKYLAMALFVTLPFVGFWLGIKFADNTTDPIDTSIGVECQTGVEYLPNECICPNDTVEEFLEYEDETKIKCVTQQTKEIVGLGGSWPLHTTQATWGPCAGPEGSCWEKSILYNTGRYETINYQGTTTYELGGDLVGKYESLVKKFNLRKKYCPFDNHVVDYSRSDTLYLRESVIEFPGCEQEIRIFDNLINQAIGNKESIATSNNTNETSDIKIVATDNIRSCTTDSECASVPSTCSCDCEANYINSDFEDDYYDLYFRKCSDDVEICDLYCPNSEEIACIEGQCSAVIQTNQKEDTLKVISWTPSSVSLRVAAPFSDVTLEISNDGGVSYQGMVQSQATSDSGTITLSQFETLQTIIEETQLEDMSDQPFDDKIHPLDGSTYTIDVFMTPEGPGAVNADAYYISVSCYEFACTDDFKRVKDKIIELWGKEVDEVGV